MPYIKEEDKREFRCALDELFDSTIRTPGELNYLITSLCVHYLDYYGMSYQVINDIVGALEGAKLEFYRRVAAPYEDTKIELNGDVY